MTKKEKFVQQLNNFERIELSSLHRKRKATLVSVFLVLFIFHILLAIALYPSLILVALISLSLISITGFFNSYYKMISVASIKGDSLILKNTQNKNCVTSVRSIRKMKAKRFGNTTITSIHYNLDGSLRRAILLSETNSTIEPSEAIRSAQLVFKK